MNFLQTIQSLPNVSVLLDLPYGQTKSQNLDVYYYKGYPNNRVVLTFFGGGWAGGDKRDGGGETHKRQIYTLLTLGINVVNCSYRLSPEAKFPSQVEDVIQAIKWAKRNCANFFSSPNRVGLWGGSAGGHLACLGAFGKAFNKGNEDITVKGVSSSCGVYDLSLWDVDTEKRGYALWNGVGFLSPQSPLSSLFGFDITKEDAILKSASPLHNIYGDTAVQLLHGRNDPTVPDIQAWRYAQSLVYTPVSMAGQSRVVELITVNGGHGDKSDLIKDENLQAVGYFFRKIM